MIPLLTPVLPARDDAPSALDVAALVGPAGWSRLPTAVRRRFGAEHGEATYVGRMDLHCSPVGRMFSLFAKAFGSPLSGTRATAIATSVRVADDGRGGMVWARSLHTRHDGAPHMVRSTKQLDAHGRLEERTDGGLTMGLRAFEESGALVFESHCFYLSLGRLRVRVPALLTPGTCRVVHTDLGGGLFRFDLDMVHPLWGRTFHQSGVFVDPLNDDAHHSQGSAQ
jgi:hypothetical protein